MSRILLFLLGAAAFSVAACSSQPAHESLAIVPELERQTSGIDHLIIGVHALDDRTVWASATNGTFLWTDDGGATWHAGTVPGADSLQFRDVHAVSLDEAYLLSIGPGDNSRIYHTTDRGASWDMQFMSEREETFFDCFDFWEDGTGIAFSDAADRRFPIIRKEDGSWMELPGTPAAQENEGGFAASGTCLVTLGSETVLIGTGNAAASRVLRSEDRGESWDVVDVPIPGGNGAGIATLAFHDAERGVAMGGNIGQPDSTSVNVATTSDGGRSWIAATPTPFDGAVYGSAFAPDGELLVAVGPGGAAYSTDFAETWAILDTITHWSVDFGRSSAGWMVGPNGTITRISL